MSRAKSLLVSAIFLASTASAPNVSSGLITSQPPAAEVTMEQVGKSFIFDYGDLEIRVRYLSASELEWEQVKGPAVGLKGEEEYEFTVIRTGVYFIWWQEEDTAVVTQVVDFEKQRVNTTWTSPEKKLTAFEGTIRPEPS